MSRTAAGPPSYCTVNIRLDRFAGVSTPGTIRRSIGPPDTAILSARLTDRPLRPLFPKDYRNETQIVISVMSADQKNQLAAMATQSADLKSKLKDADAQAAKLDQQLAGLKTSSKQTGEMLSAAGRVASGPADRLCRPRDSPLLRQHSREPAARVALPPRR